MNKASIIAIVAAGLVIALASCGSDSHPVDVYTAAAEATAYGEESTYEPVTPIEDISINPGAFLGNGEILTLAGFVTNVEPRAFYLENEDGSALIRIDYRGNQAMPRDGDEVIVRGQLQQNCCDPELLMLMTMHYELKHN